jgi:hypothetical protein
MDSRATDSPGEQLGLLLGPEAQSDDLLIEETIPLGSGHGFSNSLAMLGAGIESVQPRLAEARRERSQTIVGLYRILTPGHSENDFEFLSLRGQEHSSISSVRCCFVFVPLSASETSLHVLLRKGEHWERIQEVTLQSEPPSPNLTRKVPAPTLKFAQGPRSASAAASIAEIFQRRDRLWMNITLATLLLLSLAANTLMVWLVRRVPRETVNLQPLSYQIGELSAAVSKLQSTTTAPAPPQTPPTISEPATAFEAATAATSPKRISDRPPATGRLAIAKKPALIRPSEIFQFKVQGDTVPEVVWSSEGPGSIDPFYGLYRAPNQFTGEAKVKITATSWRGSQSVTFTLKGAQLKGAQR